MSEAEFPGIATWMGPPRAWSSNRDGKKPCYITWHYTAGAEGRTAAENGAAYDKRRTDGTSCHFFCDQDTIVQMVLTMHRSNSAYAKGNRLGVHIEICGTLQTEAQWFDEASNSTLWNTAKLTAAILDKYSWPTRRLTVAETRAAWYSFPGGPGGGINGHVDITRAYPEDGGTHTDPGPQFPWAVMLDRVRYYRTATAPTPTPVPILGGGDYLMYMAQVAGNDSVYVSTSMNYRGIDYPTFQFYVNVLKLPFTMVNNLDELRARCGEEYSESKKVATLVDLPQHVKDDIAKVAADAARAGAGNITADDMRALLGEQREAIGDEFAERLGS